MEVAPAVDLIERLSFATSAATNYFVYCYLSDKWQPPRR